jgi:hypothetical protein
MNITIKVTEQMQQAAKFSKQTPSEFIGDWIMAGVQACEDDYIIDPRTGKIIGDRLEN